MSSGKRYNNANLNSFFEKSSGQGSSSQAGNGVVHKGMLILQGPGRASQRSRGGKLAVPKPVNLPSLRKENQGNDPNTQLVPTPGASGSWHKPDDNFHGPSSGPDRGSGLSARGQGAWHTAGAASSAPQASHHQLESQGSSASQFLNTEEYPTLEAATHNKPAASKTKKIEKSPPSSGEQKRSQEGARQWSEDDRHSVQSSHRSQRWYEDERYGPSENYTTGHSAWDSDYRRNDYYGRGQFDSQHGNYYGHGPVMYGPPPDRPHGGYYPESGMGHPYPEPHQRGPYPGHYHPGYGPGGHYHHDYRPGYDYPGDPYMDRSLFPPPPPPPPPPRSAKDSEDLGERSSRSDVCDPEREEYDLELRKRAQELGAKMKNDAEAGPQTSQNLDTQVEGRIKLVRRQSNVSREGESQLASLPSDDKERSSSWLASRSSQLVQSEEERKASIKQATEAAKEAASLAMDGPLRDSSSSIHRRTSTADMELPVVEKDLDWEAQVDAEEKAKAARRERAIRDAQMRREPPTLLRQPARPARVERETREAPERKGAEVQVGSQPLPQRRSVETQSIGIQAQPPPPPPRLAAPSASKHEESAREERQAKKSVRGVEDSEEGAGGKPSVPGPWGRGPPASIQAQKAASQPAHQSPSPTPRSRVERTEVEVQAGADVVDVQSEAKPVSKSPTPEESKEGFEDEQEQDLRIPRMRMDRPRQLDEEGVERYEDGGRGGFRGGRGRRGRGGRGRGETRSDAPDWRVPRTAPVEQKPIYEGRMRSDYMVPQRGGRFAGRRHSRGGSRDFSQQESAESHRSLDLSLHESRASSQGRALVHQESRSSSVSADHASHSRPREREYGGRGSRASPHGRDYIREGERNVNVRTYDSHRQENRRPVPNEHPHPHPHPHGGFTREIVHDRELDRGGRGRGMRDRRYPKDENRQDRPEPQRPVGVQREAFRGGRGSASRERAPLSRPHVREGDFEGRQGTRSGPHAPAQAPSTAPPAQTRNWGGSVGNDVGKRAPKVANEMSAPKQPAVSSSEIASRLPANLTLDADTATTGPSADRAAGSSQAAPNPLASGLGGNVVGAQQPVMDYSLQLPRTNDPPIQFGQFGSMMRGMLFGMPGPFTTPRAQFGSLNADLLNPDAPPLGIPIDKPDRGQVEELATTQEGVSCLPENLMVEASVGDTADHQHQQRHHQQQQHGNRQRRTTRGHPAVSSSASLGAVLPDNLLEAIDSTPVGTDRPTSAAGSVNSQGHFGVRDHHHRGRGRRGGRGGGRGVPRGGRSGYRVDREHHGGRGGGDGGRGRGDGRRGPSEGMRGGMTHVDVRRSGHGEGEHHSRGGGGGRGVYSQHEGGRGNYARGAGRGGFGRGEGGRGRRDHSGRGRDGGRRGSGSFRGRGRGRSEGSSGRGVRQQWIPKSDAQQNQRHENPKSEEK